MRKSRIGAFAAASALASATVLGGAGVAQAQESDSITGAEAEVTATANDNCEVTFAFADGVSEERLESVNWVVDYRIGDEAPTIANYTDEAEEELDERLSVFRPVVASNQDTVDALNNNDDYDYDVALMSNTVNLNDLVEANESGEHTLSFKFYRGSADWNSEENFGEVTVTGCDTVDEEDGFIGSVIDTIDVFGSLEDMS